MTSDSGIAFFEHANDLAWTRADMTISTAWTIEK